jgi:hypothetical protein
LKSAEASAPPTFKGHVDAAGSAALRAAADNAAMRKLIEGVHHLAQKLSLPSFGRYRVGGIADHGVTQVGHRRAPGDLEAVVVVGPAHALGGQA